MACSWSCRAGGTKKIVQRLVIGDTLPALSTGGSAVTGEPVADEGVEGEAGAGGIPAVLTCKTVSELI